MGRPRRSKPTSVTLAISDGDTIRIKERLTAGEDNDITSYSVGGLSTAPDGKNVVHFDAGRNREITAAVYLLGWSLADEDGAAIFWNTSASMQDRIAVLRSLDAATLREIGDAIGKHREAQQQALQGNATSEGSGTAPPSPSAA